MKSAHDVGQSVPVLMYHSVARETDGELARYTIHPERFARHMGFLTEQGYVGHTVSDLADAMSAGRRLPGRPVVITFDDGYLDFYTDALPVLERHGFPATLYVPSGYVGNATSWFVTHPADVRPVLDEEQLIDTSRRGVEIGAHSVSHPELDLLKPPGVELELTRCKSALEDCIGTPVRSFSYPFGYYSRRTRHAVIAAGYSSACRVDNLPASMDADPFAIPRLTVPATGDVEQLAGLLQAHAGAVHRAGADAKRFVWRQVRRARHAG